MKSSLTNAISDFKKGPPESCLALLPPRTEKMPPVNGKPSPGTSGLGPDTPLLSRAGPTGRFPGRGRSKPCAWPWSSAWPASLLIRLTSSEIQPGSPVAGPGERRVEGWEGRYGSLPPLPSPAGCWAGRETPSPGRTPPPHLRDVISAQRSLSRAWGGFGAVCPIISRKPLQTEPWRLRTWLQPPTLPGERAARRARPRLPSPTAPARKRADACPAPWEAARHAPQGCVY